MEQRGPNWTHAMQDRISAGKVKFWQLLKKSNKIFRDKVWSELYISHTPKNTVFPHQETRWNYGIFCSEKL